MIDIRIVGSDAKLSKAFHDFPYTLYAGSDCWIPIDKGFESLLFNPSENPIFHYCVAERWVAIRDGECVGRIAAIVNRRWLEKVDEPIGRIGRFECVDDMLVARRLLNAAEDWLRRHGMTQVMGPLGFCNLDQQGLTIKGFELMAAVGSSLTKPYYPEMWEEAGYTPLQDWYEYRLTVPSSIPERLSKVAQTSRSRFNLKVIVPQSQSGMLELGHDIMELYDSVYEPLFGTFPLGYDVHEFYIKNYLSILKPNYVVAVREGDRVNGRMVGFLVAMPSLAKALIKNKGKKNLMSWFRLFNSYRNPQEMEILLAGVASSHRSQGVMPVMVYQILKRAIADGVKTIETTAILDGNEKAINTFRQMDFLRHKQKRCYVKQL